MWNGNHAMTFIASQQRDFAAVLGQPLAAQAAAYEGWQQKQLDGLADRLRSLHGDDGAGPAQASSQHNIIRSWGKGATWAATAADLAASANSRYPIAG